jgi:trehalose 6-phosphate synthase
MGVERFLEKYPQYQGKFSFVQIGAPSRTKIKRYSDFVREVEETAERINARFRTGRWQPIVFRKRHHSHTEVNRFYRAADVCLVTSLHDGMNLVAKEYLASRQDAEGMLVLSPFTGAARELPDALIVNPYDTERLADAIFRALEMEPRERKARMTRMRSIVQQNNVYRWAGNLIGELCALRVDATLAPVATVPPALLTSPKRAESDVICEEPVYEFNDAATRRQSSDDIGEVSDVG